MITCIPSGDPRTDRYLFRGCLLAAIAALLLVVAVGGWAVAWAVYLVTKGI